MPWWLLTVRGRLLLGGAGLLAFFACMALIIPWDAGGATILATVGLQPSPERATPLAAAAALVFMLAGALLMATLSSQTVISVEAGGLRWRRGTGAGYLAYGAIKDARLSREPRGRAALVLTTTGGAVRLALDDVQPSELLGRVLKRLAAQQEAKRPRTEVAMLARGDRDLATWLAAVRAATGSTTRTDAFRAAPMDVDALERTFSDEDADHDLRAAAAHALLAGGDEERARRAAQAIGMGAPPLVVAAAAMAPAGRVRLATGVVEEAMRFLAVEDRKALAAARSVADELAELEAVHAVGRECGADREKRIRR